MSDLARLSPYFGPAADDGAGFWEGAVPSPSHAARGSLPLPPGKGPEASGRGRPVYGPHDLDRAMFGVGAGEPDRPARKIRSEEVWRQARRAWEGGETAASVARRFDVGLANVWRRRSSEGWSREAPEDRAPEPPEGWRRFAERRLAEFDEALARERALAGRLAAMMTGEPVEDAPLWHLGFVYRWRAEHLGPEVAAQDRARAAARGDPLAEAFWEADGGLRPLAELDHALVKLERAEWRAWAGLPDGAAEAWP